MKRLSALCILAGIFILFLSSGCVGKKTEDSHFLTKKEYRDQVHEQFLKRKELASNRNDELFSVFEREDLTTEQREALEFLYAYMPLSDLADYDGSFFLGQVNAAFKAREYFDWGKAIPEGIFRHFVLVYRVNNENLDTARQVFFEELKDRVKGLSMERAALEVNHWCHEKVTYRGTDGRTSAPLALARTSWGRCGEESTFTTAALRSVGIPARQCYTPRWAHTDDNHAWVEVWINGKWYYMGACEPEPELNVAWFTGPAKRAMMVHTNVFGLYNGPEEKNLQTDLYSIINLLGNYTDTRYVYVKVTDEQGNPVKGAEVKFNVYNYAEFYPITTAFSDLQGKVSIVSGKGDLLIWASKDGMYGYEKSSPENKEELVITLNRKPGSEYEETIIIEPPVEQSIKELDPGKIAENAIRLAREDSIRNAYMATFMSEKQAHAFASENKLDPAKSWDYLNKAQGNWKEISDFMSRLKDNPHLFAFLESLREKDLRDTPADYLSDHLENGDKLGVLQGISEDLIVKNIYSPRIALELIRPWRTYFQEKLPADFVSKAQADVNEVISYVKENIIIDEGNYYKCPISPRGVYELKLADKGSRDILFVALCRSMGIPSRIDPVTNRPQYIESGQWHDVNFEPEAISPPKGSILFANVKENIVKPAYSTHYSIARYENGDFVTLRFRGDNLLKELPGKVTVDAGYYRLMIGSRANDGSVTIHTQYLNIGEKDTKKLEIKLPEVEGRIQVQGIVDMNTRVTLTDGKDCSLKELSKGKGIIVCFADPDKEPTKHILQDLPMVQKALEEWGGGVLFAIPDDKWSSAFDASVFKDLPGQAVWSVDNSRIFLNAVAGALQIDFTNNFPLTVYLSSNGGILFSSQGYRIGIGENILKTIEAEKATKK